MNFKKSILEMGPKTLFLKRRHLLLVVHLKWTILSQKLCKKKYSYCFSKVIDIYNFCLGLYFVFRFFSINIKILKIFLIFLFISRNLQNSQNKQKSVTNLKIVVLYNLSISER